MPNLRAGKISLAEDAGLAFPQQEVARKDGPHDFFIEGTIKLLPVSWRKQDHCFLFANSLEAIRGQ